MKSVTETIRSDVLVIGGGAAGCRAAIEASLNGSSVVLVNKYPIGHSGTTITAMITYTGTMGELGVSPQDSPDVLFWDVAKGGRSLGNQDLIEVFCRGARDSVLDLESYGMKWDKVDGKFDATRLPGHTFARGNHRDAVTGLALQRVLTDRVRREKNVRIIDHMMITRLLKDGNRVTGALGFDVTTGAFVTFVAGAVILATGGAGRLFKVTSMPEDARGDGYAFAYRAGATMIDMEYQQFYPSCVVFPTSVRGVMFPGGVVYPKGARLTNSLGERFMHKYDPENQEMATRDMLSRGIALEVAAGRGGEHGGVFADASMIPGLVETYPKSFGLWKSVGMTSFDKIEVAPGLHFTLGGVKINTFCETSVPGLYAAGEVAGGMHGANRLGGNALTETQVFGKIAGQQAASFARYNKVPCVDESEVEREIKRATSFLGTPGEDMPKGLIAELQEIMYGLGGLIRSEEGLNQAKNKLLEIKGRASQVKVGGGMRYNLAWIDALDVQNMMLVAEMICTSALQRKESRGAHYRSDYPTPDDSYLKHFCLALDNDGMTVSTSPVIRTRQERGGLK